MLRYHNIFLKTNTIVKWFLLHFLHHLLGDQRSYCSESLIPKSRWKAVHSAGCRYVPHNFPNYLVWCASALAARIVVLYKLLHPVNNHKCWLFTMSLINATASESGIRNTWAWWNLELVGAQQQPVCHKTTTPGSSESLNKAVVSGWTVQTPEIKKKGIAIENAQVIHAMLLRLRKEGERERKDRLPQTGCKYFRAPGSLSRPFVSHSRQVTHGRARPLISVCSRPASWIATNDRPKNFICCANTG